MKQLTITIQNSKFKVFLEFIKPLEYVSISENKDISIPEQHKKLARNRVKSTKKENLLDWNKVKDSFDGI